MPRGYSVFHAPALVRDCNLGELRRLFDRAIEAKCNIIETFGSWYFIGGGLAPYGPDDPAWADWFEVVVHEATARGLYTKIRYACDWQVLVPDTAKRHELVRGFAQWCLDHPTVWAVIANEARKNGWGEADDPALLRLVDDFRAVNRTTLLWASDPLDTPPNSVDGYNAAQRTIAQHAVSGLLVHPARKDRFEWVNHLYGAAQTPGAVGFTGICWPEEPMGMASHDVPGRRDGSTVAHVAASIVGAMIGAYTFMHRQLEDDACPGLLESAKAAEIPGSPDYRFYNSSFPGSPVASFAGFEGGKCRTISNGQQGWAVAYGETDGAVTLAPGWHEVDVTEWRDGDGICRLQQVTKGSA